MRSDVELITKEKGIPTIFVDADSCPVKAEIVERNKGVYGKVLKPFRSEERLRFTMELIKNLSKFAGI